MGCNLSVYIVTSDSERPVELRNKLCEFLDCKLPALDFRMSNTPDTLFFLNLVVNNVLTLRTKLKKYQHNNPFTSIFLLNHDRERKYYPCC